MTFPVSDAIESGLGNTNSRLFIDFGCLMDDLVAGDRLVSSQWVNCGSYTLFRCPGTQGLVLIPEQSGLCAEMTRVVVIGGIAIRDMC